MEFTKHAFLKKYLNDFEEEHPLLVSFELNPNYMDYVESLLKELDEIPNLSMKIEEMKKDFSNWESTFSELEFTKKVRTLNPEFIKTSKTSRTPDLRVKLFEEKVHFEVKMLVENDETRRIYPEIWKLESDLLVRVSYGILDKSQTDSLIEFITDKIKAYDLGKFSHEGSDIEIRKRESPKTKRTSVITFHRARHITYEPIRRKVFMDFYEKLTQFESCKPIFWVIDCNRWKYDLEDFKRVVYGTIMTDKTIAKFLPGLSDIVPSVTTIELFNGTDLIPTLTYPQKDGLFFLKEAECLNGVITKTRVGFDLLINPFAKQQITIESIRRLQEVLTSD